ncbi:histidine phosphatase family protein [Paraglaciecola sp.]|uniref:histidine phosphatase family protein n=1 Tax=Paraglaciecola sp. TaxID=1920173 RepID=UPI003EF7F535
MPRYVYLCRHGQSQWNAKGILQGQLDCKLSDTGLQQAAGLAGQAQSWHVQHLFHSGLTRAQQTAQICAEQLNLVPQSIAGTQERNFGNWQGKTTSDLSEYQHFRQQCYSKIHSKPNAQSESTLDVRVRMQGALKAIAEVTTGNVMLISHGDAIDCLLSLWTSPVQLGNCQYVRLTFQAHNFVWSEQID